MVLDLRALSNSHDGRITCLDLSADGSALCTGSWDTNLKVQSSDEAFQIFHYFPTSFSAENMLSTCTLLGVPELY